MINDEFETYCKNKWPSCHYVQLNMKSASLQTRTALNKSKEFCLT